MDFLEAMRQLITLYQTSAMSEDEFACRAIDLFEEADKNN